MTLPSARLAVLTPNASEAEELTGCADPAEAAARLVSDTGAAVLITLGGDGALLLEPGGSVERLPALAVDVVDTTGAGDTVNGALAAELARGPPGARGRLVRAASRRRCRRAARARVAACRRARKSRRALTVASRSRPSLPPVVAAGAGLSAAGLAAWAGWIEPRRLVVREFELELPHWPERLSGLRAGVMSDLHAGVPHVGLDKIRRAVDTLNAQEPDIHLLLGDYLDASQFFRRDLAPERVADELARLRSRLGTIAVIGNHDWRNSGDRMWRALEGAGITVLEDRAVETDDGFWVAGLADLRHRRPDIGAALREVPRDAPVLMLSHDPDMFPGVPEPGRAHALGPHARRAGRDPAHPPPAPALLLRRALRGRAHRRARAAPARDQRRRDERAADPTAPTARGRHRDLA